VDLARSATACIRDYPLGGTGLGTFGLVFPRYQSGRFGDRWADFLHNDALQLVCEMGVIGALILLVGLGVVIGGTVRAIRGRRDPFARWTATGALLGVGAILLHSLFDYNLSKITANGLVCAVLLGVAFAAARMSGSLSSRTRRLMYWRVPLAKPLARAGVGLVAVGLLASIPFLPMISALRADIRFNRHLARVAEPDDYFFLPTRRTEGRRDGGTEGRSPEPYTLHPPSLRLTLADSLDRALALRPDNPRYLAEAAARARAQADDRLRRRAVERARTILGPDLERRDPKGFDRIVAAIAATIKPQVLDERRPLLEEAEAHLRRAIDAAPTVARYHLDLADVLAELDAPRRRGLADDDEPAKREIAREAQVALWLAPNRPAVLFDAGRLLLLAGAPVEESLRDPMTTRPRSGRTRRFDVVRDCFRRALAADASYGSLVYPLVQATMGGRSALLAVTPRTVGAYEQLYRVLWGAGDWVPALACLDTIDELARNGVGPMTTSPRSGMPVRGEHNPVMRAWEEEAPETVLRIRASVAQRRGDILGVLGRWDERAAAVSQYRVLLRRRLRGDLADVRRLRTMGRAREALAVCLRLLQRDWSNPDALLEAAEIAALPRVLDGLPRWNTSLDFLYRLVINNTALSPSVHERAVKVLDGLVLRQASDRLVAAFMRGALAVLAGRASEGTAALDGLAEREDDVVAGWRQRHLIWYYLGLGHEAMHDRAKAIAAYRRVVDIVPTHRRALVRLAALGADVAPALEQLTPAVACHVDFGGKVVFLGFTLTRIGPHPPAGAEDARPGAAAPQPDPVPVAWWPRIASARLGTWQVTYFWEFRERMDRRYRVGANFCGSDWKGRYDDGHGFRSDDGDFPNDSPRCGETLVERRVLDGDLSGVEYFTMFLWAPNPPAGLPPTILSSASDGGFAAAVGHILR